MKTATLQAGVGGRGARDDDEYDLSANGEIRKPTHGANFRLLLRDGRLS